MKIFALVSVLFLVGCGSSGGPIEPTGQAGTTGTGGTGGTVEPQWPIVVTTNWTVQLNNGSPPSCLGPMTLILTQEYENAIVSVQGSWSCTETAAECTYVREFVDQTWQCISFSGSVVGLIQRGGINMDMNTSPTTYVDVSGTISTSTIVGSVLFSDGSIPFYAVLN